MSDAATMTGLARRGLVPGLALLVAILAMASLAAGPVRLSPSDIVAALLGRGDEFLKHFMEIRGVGVVDVREMFGIRGIRIQKRIEVEVRLERWVEGKYYDRTGLEYDTTEILGVKIPQVLLPIFPGKNITVIAETIAMNHMLKTYGLDPAERFNRQVSEGIARRGRVRTLDYLRKDEE